MTPRQIIEEVIKALPEGVRPPDEIEDTVFGGVVASWDLPELSRTYTDTRYLFVTASGSGGVKCSLMTTLVNNKMSFGEFMDFWKSDRIQNFLKKYCGHKEG